MRRALNIAIVGYGIAGIAAAIHLRRSGHRIVHFERNDPPVADGAGMLLHPAAMRELDQLGVLTAAVESGAPVRQIRAQTISGRSLMDFRYGDVVDGQSGLGIQRRTLHRLLSSIDPERARVEAGREVISVESDTGCLTDQDRVRHGPFDLIVVADGMHSKIRRQIVAPGQLEQRDSAAAVVGLLADSHRLATDSLTQYFEGTRHLSVWPVGGEAAGGELRCSFAINVTLAEAQTLRDEQQRLELLPRLFPNLWSLVSDRVERSSVRVAIYRDVELARTCSGRVAIIGDAAHSMSPQLGTGAQLALADAATLASIVDRHDDVAGALRAFMRTRGPQLRRHHLASRWLTPLFQSDNPAIAFMRDQLFAKAMNLSHAKRIAHALFS